MTIFGLMLIMGMVLIVGIGVDVMRYERDRVHLQNTLDRAVLAAADLDQPLSPTAVVEDYFAKAGMSDSLTSVLPEVALGSRTVTATADMEVDTFFMQMFGVDTLTIDNLSVAEEAAPNMEISLVLDISGSMRNSNRMNQLRPAARDFVTSVVGGDGTGGTGTITTVNLIPYAGQTNPGPEMFEYLGGVRFGQTQDPDGYFPERGQDISNIVFYFDQVPGDDNPWDYAVKIDSFPDGGSATHISNDLDDYFEFALSFIRREVPAVADLEATIGVSIKGGNENKTPTEYYDVDGGLVDGPTENTGNVPNDVLQYSDFYNQIIPNISSCLEMTDSDFDNSNLPDGSTEQVGHFMKWTIASSVMDWGWCPTDDTAIQYAQTSETDLHTFIDNIRMHDGTGTFYGMKWALTLLDPDTSDAFTHLSTVGVVDSAVADRPAAWDDADTVKYIVLMTDGQITDQHRPFDKLDPIHATVEFDNQEGNPQYKSSTRSTNLAWFYEQCDLAKTNGVIVYTIAFDAPSGASTEMSNCASSPAHFFEVGNGDLDAAFTAIASQINQLRLTQ